MSTQDSNTKKIAYGELHFYYPFKFDNKYSYTQIHKKIEKVHYCLQMNISKRS